MASRVGTHTHIPAREPKQFQEARHVPYTPGLKSSTVLKSWPPDAHKS